MENVHIPILDWLIGDVYSKRGNCYVGSVGAEGISSNAFCYKIWLERNDNGSTVICQTYDCISVNDTDNYHNATFSADEQGLVQAQVWVNREYADYLANGRNKLKLTF